MGAMRYIKTSELARRPAKAHEGDAGYDLYTIEEVRLDSKWEKIPVGLKLEMPEGIFGRITGRSSTRMAGIQVCEGIIDNGFRGELFVIAKADPYYSTRSFVPAGSRIAQIIFQRVESFVWYEADALKESSRGENGFGSSGS